MAGYGLPKEQHLSLVLESNLVRSGLNIKVINGSVSGSTSSGGLNRAEWSLSEPGIDLIILGLGANDMLRGIQPDETERNLEEIIKIANSKKIKIIIAGMVAPITHGTKYKKNFDAIYDIGDNNRSNSIRIDETAKRIRSKHRELVENINDFDYSKL